MFWKKIKSSWWPEVVVLTLASALVYLPRVREMTYYKDNWYFFYDLLVAGPKVLVDLTLHTRPLRAPLYEFYYALFGLHPVPHHLAFYVTRLLGGFGALWLFHLLWPQQRRADFFMALLFLIYPGFLWWLAGFEFQPYVFCITLQVFSFVFTLKAVEAGSPGKRAVWVLGAVLSGWIALGMLEYAIGMEAFRILCVCLFVKHKHPGLDFRALALQTARASALFLLIPLSFVLWYQFFFENWRRAQEAGVQIGHLLDSPLTALWWLVHLLQSTLDVLFLAWGVPLYENFFGLRLRDVLLGLSFAAATILIVFLADRLLRWADDEEGGTAGPAGKWQSELLLIGLFGTLAGLLPVVLANRTVTFDRYSHYAFPASIAGVLFVGGLVHSIGSKRLRSAALAVLVGIAALTHYANASRAVDEEKTVIDFWWQVTWRAPSIRRDTMLVVLYPDIDYAEGNDIVWGPANFIYYPEKQYQTPVTLAISSARMEQDSLTNIVLGTRDFQKVDLIIKDISVHENYANLLVLTQPSAGSCVHAVDARWPTLSTDDGAFLLASAAGSKIENIVPGPQSPVPPGFLFGSEPSHDWCYYYQKADLARQQGDWQEVARLGDEAGKLGLHPNDQIEWMPFLQAYAYLGDLNQVKQVSTKINTQDFYQHQACQTLRSMAEQGYPLRPDMAALADQLFCPPQK